MPPMLASWKASSISLKLTGIVVGSRFHSHRGSNEDDALSRSIRAQARGGTDVPEYPHALQFRAACDRRGDSRVGAAVRSQAQRIYAPLEGERGRIPARRRGRLGRGAPASGITGDLAAGA